MEMTLVPLTNCNNHSNNKNHNNNNSTNHSYDSIKRNDENNQHNFFEEKYALCTHFNWQYDLHVI